MGGKKITEEQKEELSIEQKEKTISDRDRSALEKAFREKIYSYLEKQGSAFAVTALEKRLELFIEEPNEREYGRENLEQTLNKLRAHGLINSSMHNGVTHYFVPTQPPKSTNQTSSSLREPSKLLSKQLSAAEMSSLYQAAGFIAQGKSKMIQKQGVNFVNINDIEIIAPIDENLKSIIQLKDKILCSTFAEATVYINPIGSSKTTMHSWKTPVLICENGVAFLVSQKFSQKPVNYVPMGFILWTKPRSGRTLRILRAAGFQHIINLNLIRNRNASRKEFFTYVDNLKPIWEQKVKEMEENIKSNLSTLDKIPKFREYNRNFKYVPKLVYKRAKKGFKKQK